MRKLLVAGNWKMNGSVDEAKALSAGLLAEISDGASYDVAVFPPFVHIPAVAAQLQNSDLIWGGQNLSAQAKGAFTSEISASMLAELGCQMVLVGHSECREYGHESNQLVAEKFKQALSVGLTPILCVGETIAQREAEQTESVVWQQIQAVIELVGMESLGQGVIAYEPVWAIGTGLTATAEQAQQVHQFIRSHLSENDDIIARRMRLLYGGSCNGSNANALFSMPDVDGGLIGGASLTVEDFMAICQQADALSNGE
ncbi:triose-phosphate isomerase [Marinicella rhabdoformis]|uniref:triose-phosphate isomerase n=1 Tax=Marinicella rhabdoformis TaxID=2580566 RepID=UPI0012AECE0D|nr:triose-phosphate isomerase [Marinicella rhabdoformis]